MAPTEAVGADGADEFAAGEGLVERLAMVCRAAPPELSPGPFTLLAHVVWWQGDGALARTALDRALEVDPDYRLATLLATDGRRRGPAEGQRVTSIPWTATGSGRLAARIVGRQVMSSSA